VRRGTIHGICGENGAGKSTLMKILAGVHSADTYEGDVKLNGEVVKFVRDAIHQAIETGIAIVHQELALIPKLTVGENIYLGREPLKNGVIDWNKLYADTHRILKEYRLDIPFDSVVDDLSVGKQQMVEIAKALSENAQVLILDEPTSALTEAEVDKLMDILNDLRDRGVTCLYITHKMEEFFRVTDDITVFRDGQVVGTVETRDVDHEKLVAHGGTRD
jgi:D-xylose transport system ATP-binding protein